MAIRAETMNSVVHGLSGFEHLNRHISNTVTSVEHAVSDAETSFEHAVEASMRGSAGIMNRVLEFDKNANGGYSAGLIMAAGMCEIFAIAGTAEYLRENPLVLGIMGVASLGAIGAYCKYYLTPIETSNK